MTHVADPLAWAVAAFRDRKLADRYARAASYLAGVQDLAFATAKYEAVYGDRFGAFAYNRCGGVVDALADRLHVEAFAAEDDAIGQRAKDLWDANRMDKRSGEVHKEAFAAGDGFVLVWPESPDLRDANGAQIPAVWPMKAPHVRVLYDDEFPDRIVLAARSWIAHGRRRLNLYFPDRTEKYVTKSTITAYASGADSLANPLAGWPTAAASFEEHRPDGDEAWPVANPWGVVPVFHFGNNAGTNELGRSELADVIPLQDALNNVLTNLVAGVELVGFPLKAIIGLDADDPEVTTALGRIEAGLSKILAIPGGVGPDAPQPSIAEFSAGNLAQVIAVVDLFDTMISRVSRVPIHWLQMSGGFDSGRALRIAESPFVAKLEDRQTAFGTDWADALRLALRMTGAEDPGELSPVWRSAAPLSVEDRWDVALQQSAVGLPLEQILREAGYDEDTIAKIAAAKAEAVEAFESAITGVRGAAADDGGDDEEEGVAA
ncbi:MAG: phage portal protein [Chloroflexota bacterium]|nr:phage portal protein [Chloroflexota bacterium]